MATPWPQRKTWPALIREHATCLSNYIHEVLRSIDQTGSQTVPADLVRDIANGAITFVLKTQHTPDLSTVHDALKIAQTESKNTAENTAQDLSEIKRELTKITETLQQSTADIQQNINTGEEARAAAKEATELGKATLEMTREIKNRNPQEQASKATSYAAAAARGAAVAGIYNTQSLRTPLLQMQREVIVNIRDPITVQSLRAMNPRNLKAHVERAVEQSGNEHIASVKIVSSNQLKSGDLSVKTTTSSEVEALKQFTDDWVHRIGNGAVVQIPTYGIIVHGIRTSAMDMDKQEENKTQILQDNRPFIPRAEIKYMGWLTRNATAKTASSIIIEFTRPEDANKMIDEGLIWQGEVFQCERYERRCRVKQCFKCQKYGHIGTQCKAPTACGYCAQEHDTRDCPSRFNRNAPRKCATCRGEHEAWSRVCPTRKEEVTKAKSMYEMRPHYHHVLETAERTAQPEIQTIIRRSRPSQAAAPTQPVRITRNRSRLAQGQKRTSTNTTNEPNNQESPPTQAVGSQRPQRNIRPTRKAMEAMRNTQPTQDSISDQMDTDSDTQA